MFKRLFEQRKYLSAITAGILVIQTFLPSSWGVPKAFADDLTYTMAFTDGTGLTLDSGLTTSGGNLHFKVTPDSTGMGTGLPAGDTIVSMTYVQDRLWAILSTAGTLYKSDDDGANWTQVDPQVGPVKVFEDVVGVGGDDLVVGGSLSGGTGLYYSGDNGATWSASVWPVGFNPQTVVAITYDVTNDKAYAAGSSGNVIVTSDDGANWTEAKIFAGAPDEVGTPTDIVCFGSNSIALIGSSIGGATINFTTNGGTNWFTGANPAGGTNRGFFSNGLFYAYHIGASTLAQINIGGGGQMDDAGDWTDISGNLSAYVPWRIQGMYSHPSSTGVVFAILKTTPGFELVSTIDGGVTWLSHASVAGTSGNWSTSPMAINASTPTSLIIGGQDVTTTNATVWSASFNPANTSVVINTGITGFSSIAGLTASYHSQKIGTIGIAFSSDGSDWYYYSGTWQHSSDDNSSFSTDVDTLGTLPAGLPISGSLYLKLYNQTSTGLTIVDSLTVNYSTGEGDGPGDPEDPTDNIPPTSQVGALPAFSTTPDRCNPILTVAATASDNNPDFIRSVTLYISSDGRDFAPWGDTSSNPDYSYPYSWDIPVSEGETWYFYSIAVDKSNNREISKTNVEASTTIDIVAPTVGESSPYDQQGITDSNFVGITNPVEFHFSESIVPETFEYEFYRADDELKTPVVGTNVEWNADNSSVKVTHSVPLDYSIEYVFDITKATDPAGNELNDPLLCPCSRGGWRAPGQYENPRRSCPFSILPPPPKTIYFVTQESINPDLLASKIEVKDGPNDDKSYNVGDKPQFTITLTNNSTHDAENVAVKFDVPDGLSYVETDEDGGGTMTPTEQNGKVVSLVWRNNTPIKKDNPVEIKFTMQVNSPATVFSITQTIKIFDSINFIEDDTPLTRSATLKIARNPQFTASSKIVKLVDGFQPAVDEDGRILVQHGGVVTYEITIKNTGTTIGDIEFTDFVPAVDNPVEPLIFYQEGSLEYAGNWDEDSPPVYESQTIHATATDVLPNSPALTLTFNAIVRGPDIITEEIDVTNSAYVWDPNIYPVQQVELNAPVHVPGGPVPPLMVISQNPAPDSVNNGLKSRIEAGFNKPIDLDAPFEYSLTEGGTELTMEELEDWTPTWEDFNGNENAKFVLTPPEDPDTYDGELLVGAEYEITIISATAATEDAETLEEPVTWKFTTADPTLEITTPTAPVYELKINTKSDKFTVRLVDSISGQPYKAEENISIGLKAFLGDEAHSTGIFFNGSNRQLGENAKITIEKNDSTGYFYYQDSEATPEGEWLTIRTYEDPYRGWVDDEKYVVITTDEQAKEGLSIYVPSTTLGVGQMSGSITVWATDENCAPTNLPEGKLYFYTSSTAGSFYDQDKKKFPILQTNTGENLTVQGVGDDAQFVEIGANVNSLTLFYESTLAGIEQITVSDNSPENPDVNINDASAILHIQKLEEEEEELLEELVEVTDDTGRVIDKMTIKPDEVQLLPNKTQLFKATAYDTKGKIIDNAKFKWFTLIDKSGTIKKDGDDKTTHQSTFTAGTDLGTYYDTVLVATLYNGKVAYATASVAVVDVVDYKGPKRLPVTGMNGLQLVLMGLTLAAAVALAWVEHYDKTHFKASDK